MLDPTSPNQNTHLLMPLLLERLIKGLAHAHRVGLMAYAFETVRSCERQGWLYGQGRTREGAIVTRARPGYSWHEYALAVDLVFDGSSRPGIQWSWDGDYVGEREKDYERLGKIMRGHGLEQLHSSGRYYDKPHFQLTYGLTIQEAFLIRRRHGLLGVWQEIIDRSKRK